MVYPTEVQNGPTVESVGKLKKMIAAKIPQSFTMQTLNDKYAWLEHQNEQCEYDAFMIGDKKLDIETYGIKDHGYVPDDEYFF